MQLRCYQARNPHGLFRPGLLLHTGNPKRHEKGNIAAQKPAEMSWEALISAGIARFIEEFHVAVDLSSRTLSYLQAAREYERMVGGDPDRRAYVIQIQRTKSNLAGSTRSPESRTLEIEIIAGQAGLRYEDVPDLALILEGTVWQLERFRLATSEFFQGYTTQHPWARLLVGWWPEKLTFGCAWVFGTCVLNAGTGCRPAINWTVILSLAGPICALVHMAFLAWKR